MYIGHWLGLNEKKDTQIKRTHFIFKEYANFIKANMHELIIINYAYITNQKPI
jgi:hypothetical protein